MPMNARSLARKIKIPDCAYRALCTAFSPAVIRDLAHTGRSRHLSEVLAYADLPRHLPTDTSLGDVFDSIYYALHSNYRGEYVYKNALITKLLLGRHSLNTARMLSEFRSGSRKADVVILNGTSTAYEIKSDFDSFERLAGQMESYLLTFDRVYLVTSAKRLYRSEKELPLPVGIIELTSQHTLRTHRSAAPNAANISPDILFDSLRKEEYTSVIEGHFGYTPNVPNTRIYAACKKLFTKIEPALCHDLAFKAIRANRASGLSNPLLKRVPYSLRGLVVAGRTSNATVERLIDVCNEKLSNVE